MKKILFFLLMISGFAFGQNEYQLPPVNCADFEMRKDDFTGYKSIETWGSVHFSIIKQIVKKNTVYYLHAYTTDEYLTIEGSGVYFLFTDGTKWSRPNAKIKVKVNDYNAKYDYSTFITISATDVNTFLSKPIKKMRVDIFDEEIPEDKATRFIEELKCIKQAK